MIVFLLAHAHLQFSRNLQKNISYKHVHRKVPYCHTAMKMQPVYFVLAQFHPKNTLSQPPLFDMNTGGATRPFLAKQFQIAVKRNTKQLHCIAVTF